MGASSEATIPKRTVAPLFEFSASVHGSHDLGGGLTLGPTDHAGIRSAMDAYLASLRGEDREGFITYLSPAEREELAEAHVSLQHHFTAADYAGEAEERSIGEILGVLMAMRVVKSTLAKPGLHLRWENRGDGWELGGFEKVGYHISLAPEEVPEPFDAQDVAQLAEILPRVRQAFSAHCRTSFNRVANGLNFFEMGYRLEWGPVRFVMFTTALESLFITKDGSIGRRFRERISRFLSQDLAGRRQLEDTCRAIYRIRSGFVHGERISKDEATIKRAFLEVQKIARRSLQRILRDDILLAKFSGPSPELAGYLDQMP